MSDSGSIPPPPPPGGGYGAPPPPPPPPGGAYGAPAAGAEHPEGQKLLIMSIVGLLCCAPLNIYVLITAGNILKNGGGYNTGKVGTARLIAIISLVLWAVGAVLNLMGVFALPGATTTP